MQTTAASYEEWCKHYVYAETEQARLDYHRYLDNLELVTRLFDEDPSMHSGNV